MKPEPEQYRKKPVVIEAYQWNAETCVASGEILTPGVVWNEEGTDPICETLEGPHRVSPDDWIIKGVKGEYYPCKPDIFEMTYEPVTGQSTENTADENKRLRRTLAVLADHDPPWSDDHIRARAALGRSTE